MSAMTNARGVKLYVSIRFFEIFKNKFDCCEIKYRLNIILIFSRNVFKAVKH